MLASGVGADAVLGSRVEAGAALGSRVDAGAARTFSIPRAASNFSICAFIADTAVEVRVKDESMACDGLLHDTTFCKVIATHLDCVDGQISQVGY